jgi:hypothetical protein
LWVTKVGQRMAHLIHYVVLATDEADVGWLRPGTLDETAAQRFARYTEGFSVEDEDAPPLPMVRFPTVRRAISVAPHLRPAYSSSQNGASRSSGRTMPTDRQMVMSTFLQEEDAEEAAAAEAAAATDAADLSPEELAPGDGSATDRDLEDLVGPACLLCGRSCDGVGCLSEQRPRRNSCLSAIRYMLVALQGQLVGSEGQTEVYDQYQMEDGDLGIDEEELARLEEELGSADAEDFGDDPLAELEGGSALPG